MIYSQLLQKWLDPLDIINALNKEIVRIEGNGNNFMIQVDAETCEPCELFIKREDQYDLVGWYHFDELLKKLRATNSDVLGSIT